MGKRRGDLKPALNECAWKLAKADGKTYPKSYDFCTSVNMVDQHYFALAKDMREHWRDYYDIKPRFPYREKNPIAIIACDDLDFNYFATLVTLRDRHKLRFIGPAWGRKPVDGDYFSEVLQLHHTPTIWHKNARELILRERLKQFKDD